MDDVEKVKELLEKLKGKRILDAQTDGSTVTLIAEGDLRLTIDRGFYEEGVPDNSFLMVNDLKLF